MMVQILNGQGKPASSWKLEFIVITTQKTVLNAVVSMCALWGLKGAKRE